MNVPKPGNKGFNELVTDIEKGEIKIPQFQRNFVWKITDTANLLDSIIKGYPIGTFILWRTKERLHTIKNLGGLDLPEPEKDEYVNYVLDGQQRITSIFVACKGEIISRDNRDEDFSKIFIDLDIEDGVRVEANKEKKEGNNFIKFSTLCNMNLSEGRNWDAKYHEKLDCYQNIIRGYNFSIIDLKGYNLETAAEIFTVLNKHGKRLDIFEIMVAITYEDGKFDLAEKWKEFTDKLEDIKYGNIKNTIVLQLIALILNKKDCKVSTILKLNKNDIIKIWEKTIEAIKDTIDHFRSHYGIIGSDLLPYPSLIVPFAYFMYKNKKPPNVIQNKYLDDFFWRVSLAERYSSAVESKLAADVKRIEQIRNSKQPYYDWSVNLELDYIIQNSEFNVNASYTKAILCIYVYQRPKSFETNDSVNISNVSLKKSNSKNYHHFFPKAFLTKKNVHKREINSILNITIVDDYLNKIRIGAKPPSVYMKRFKENNPLLAETMKTHLIQDIESFGIWNDDYDRFLKKRAEELSKEMKKRIIERPITNPTKTIDVFMKTPEYDKLEQDYLSKKNKELWWKVKNKILARYPNVQFYMTGVYGGFKIEIDKKPMILCIIEGFKNKIKITYNIKITDDVLQVTEILEDVSKIGRHTKGEIRQYLTSIEDIDMMIKYLDKVVRYKTN